ncbi:hypothetical protein [Streptomyces sp. NPDC058657]|uniref:hypothetical protein n=1 Tax=unclassified Streptomyces TaxID=2593676 RepID=UPI00365EF8C7
MPLPQRTLLILSFALVAAQIALTAAYFFWFIPMFSGGLGPDAGESSSRASSNVVTLLSLGIGGVVIALDYWGCLGIFRSLRHRISASRPLGAACAAQLLLTGCAAVAEWALPVIACLTAFALLSACLWYDRRRFTR